MSSVLFAGLSTIDIQYFVPGFPSSNQKVKCKPPDLLVGGPALNAAVAYAFLAGEANLLSAVGHSPFNPLIQQDLQEHAVHLIDFIVAKSTNPVLATVITSANGDRSILSHHPEDHSFFLDVQALFDQLQPELVLVDGFYPQMTLRVCEEATARNIPVVFDGGSWKPHLESLLPFFDLIICSADFRPPGCNSSGDVIRFFHQHQKSEVAISRGADSILCAGQGHICEIAVEKLKIKDSLGAGDFLHGAFCYYWLKNRNFESALRLASSFASQTCRYEGTRKCFAELKKEQFI
ncbi:sugar/nucleoside kinase (ribokinase family) [Mangrovibacterium marinum]|uniref:Sugar/nucleoside kinase (Ribokinase family) n=1 Tax=Mangrovibacterium marinum TaxID=1639118 RepID=A0A2T5C3G8_9BACT|nr:PfkB family carbohydrate kinase [Mangrovibacterium marinum]PTN09318.1 sugar/nucleoside kinase (ribokinase family) [Mangrovibacterium marinum]